MKICIGTPLYEKPEPQFVVSLINTIKMLEESGHPTSWRYASSCATHYSRNQLVHDMNRIGHADIFVQIDGDMSWNPDDVAAACSTVAQGKADLIGFSYLDRRPSKISDTRWISPAVAATEERYKFQNYGRLYQDVESVGGGILVFSKECVRQMTEDALRKNRTQTLKRSSAEDIPMLFDYENGSTEDVVFCNRWRELGGTVYCDTTSMIGHVGQFTFAADPGRMFG